MPRCFGWRDYAFLLLSAPAAKAPDAMPPRVLHDATLLNELPNGGARLADGVALSGKRWRRCGAFWPKPFLCQADAAARQPGEL
jgi:hypothetical protein